MFGAGGSPAGWLAWLVVCRAQTYVHPTDLYYQALAKVYRKQDAHRNAGGGGSGGAAATAAVSTRKGQLAVLLSFYDGASGRPTRSREHCEQVLDRRAEAPGQPLDLAVSAAGRVCCAMLLVQRTLGSAALPME